MKPFLQSLAEYVVEQYSGDMQDLCMVFPNRRAGLFFTRFLSERISSPVWKPAVLTIADLMAELSDLRYGEDLDMLATLYRIFREVRKSSEGFDEFYQWGETLLSDFDDVDKYMVDAADLFRNLAQVRQLEQPLDYLTKEQVATIRRFWKSFEPSPGVHQEKFLRVWEVLDAVYRRFTETLLERGQAYEGLVCRQVASAITGGDPPEPRYSKLVVAGFNALNRCEEVLFEYLRNRNMADFFWDHDPWYTEDGNQEAGRFLRKYIRKYPPPAGASFRGEGQQEQAAGLAGREITVWPVPSDAAQARTVHRILDEMKVDGGATFHDTAIVLADEHLLVPVLHSLPERIDDINVTMGYPVSQTTVNGLMELLLVMQKNATVRGKQAGFYYRDVQALLNHRYLGGPLREERDRLAGRISRGTAVRITPGDLQPGTPSDGVTGRQPGNNDPDRTPSDGVPGSQPGDNGLLTAIFRTISDATELPAYLSAVLEQIAGGTGEEGPDAVAREHIYHIHLRLKGLEKAIAVAEIRPSAETFYRLYRKSVRSSRIPYTGEPLSGVQVMGVLETRLLDFNNVIMLSMNEGHFPKVSVSPSYIPHYLRKAFGLPTIEHQDAIYAYYFNRLIQKAGKVGLVYNNNNEGAARGEPSRFLQQLMYDPRLKVRRSPVGFRAGIGLDVPIVIGKSRDVMTRLEEYFVPGGEAFLSPSALNTYLECGLRFFFARVAGIREKEEATEDIDSPLFGTIFHEAVRRLYGNFPAGQVTRERIDTLLAGGGHIAEAVDGAIDEVLGTGGKSRQPRLTGMNLLIREVLLQYLRNVLEEDLGHLPFRILEAEEKYKAGFTIDGRGGTREVRLGGIIDRIDDAGGKRRVLDYKTGYADIKFENTEALFRREDYDRNKAAFQLLLYCWMQEQKTGGKKPPSIPVLYILKKMNDPSKFGTLKMGAVRKQAPLGDFAEIRPAFTEHLSALLKEIFDPAIPFRQTEDRRSCARCPYAGICKRESSDIYLHA